MRCFLLLFACVGLSACSGGNYPVRTHDFADIEAEAGPRHMNREQFSAVEAAEAEDDEVCVGQFCNCEVE